MSKIRLMILLLTVFCLSLSIVAAQPTAQVCSTAVEAALQELDRSCETLSRNTVCYGNSLVQATFMENATDLQFSIPSDRVALFLLAGIRASALDIVEGEDPVWGIAVVNAQANLPGTLPGQGVVMLVMGDTELTNNVPQDEAFINFPPLDGVINTGGARIRSGAGLNFNVTSIADFGAGVPVDARNEAGDWLRVVYNDSAGWIYYNLVDVPAAEIQNLPVVDDTVRTPMQSFYFSTGLGNADCQEAPDAVVIQSPQGVQVNMEINDAEISLGSTVVLETDTNQSQMTLYVLDGTANVNNLVVPEGYKALVPLNPNTQLVNDLSNEGIRVVGAQQLPQAAGQWGSCNPLSATDRQRFAELPNIPASVLNYPITLPSAPTQFCAPPGAILNPTAPPAATNPPASTPAPIVVVTEEIPIVGEFDCSVFRQASPREGMAFGVETFFWDPPNPGAATYEVTVFGNEGQVVASGSTSATSITLDTGNANPNGGATYAWTVQALDASGNIACPALEPIRQLREAAPPPTEEPHETDEPYDYHEYYYD